MAELLAMVPGVPVSMVLADDTLTFATLGEIASTGVVYRMTTTGEAVDVIYRGLGIDPTIAIEGERVVVGDSSICDSSTGGSLVSIGLEDDVTVVSRDRRCIRSLTSHESGLFWIEGQVALKFLSADAAPATPPTSLIGGSRFIIQLALLDSDTLIWTEFTQNLVSLKTMSRTGGPATLLATHSGRFAIGSGRLVFARPSGFIIRDLATGEFTELPVSFSSLQALAVDASFIYWISNSTLFVGDPDGQTSRPLARLGDTGVFDQGSLAQDDDFLYVMLREDNATRVSRIRKPGTAASFPSCVAPLEDCARACVDVETDRQHCGSCAARCGAGEVCEVGRCVCAPAFVCGGSCVDLMVDAQHCGACDNACLGGCVGGACEPFALTAGGPHLLVDDTEALFYAEGSSVKRLDKLTGASSTLHTLELPQSLVVDDSQIYAIGGSLPGIHALAKSGLSSTPLYTGRPNARDLGLVDDTLVWIEDADASNAFPRTLVRAARDGSSTLSSTTVVGLFPGAATASSVGYIVDGTSLYWLLATSDQMNGAIVRVDFATSTATLVASLAGRPTSIVARGTELHVIVADPFELGEAAVLAVAKTGGTPRHEITAANAAALVVGTAGHLTWLDGDGAFVRELDAVLEIPRTLASSLPHATKILPVDGGFYVTCDDGILFVQR